MCKYPGFITSYKVLILYTIGVTEEHGMSAEAASFAPKDISYKFLEATRFGSPIFKSPIKGFMSQFNEDGCDIVESVISPVLTKKPWLYSLACIEEALAFNFMGFPIPSQVRALYMRSLFSKKNFGKLLFWSHAGKRTLEKYPLLNKESIRAKSEVVYPAIRKVDDNLIKYNTERVNILFSGDFFRKGGVNVIDAFERLQKDFSNISLNVCSDEKIDFNTSNSEMRIKYLRKIENNKSITFGRIPRSEMINTILPETDIYLLPTYQEAFGYAVLEAMAFGIPVISTNHMAIPEIMNDGKSGFLIDTSMYDCDELFKGYVVNDIPDDFRAHVTENLYIQLKKLVKSVDLRRQMGTEGINIARDKFSFEERNKTLSKIYNEVMGS